MKNCTSVLVVAFAIFLLGSCQSWAFAGAAGKTTDVYCGLYSIYAAARLEGLPVQPGSVLRAEFLSSSKGSSFSDLQKAASQNGLQFRIFGNMTTRMLKSSRHRVILHLRGPSGGFDHFSLYAGRDGDGALLVDGEGLRSVPFPELARDWDGTGAIVSASPIGLGAVLVPYLVPFSLLGPIAVLALVVVRRAYAMLLRSLRPSFPGVAVAWGAMQVLSLVSFALCSGLLYNGFLDDEGLLADPRNVGSLMKAYERRQMPKVPLPNVTAVELREHIARGGIVIDARYAPDYRLGHIDEAVNVPVDATEEELEATLRKVPHGRRVVVYCQSAGCPFALAIGSILKGWGYDDIAMYRGGWAEWQKEIAK